MDTLFSNGTARGADVGFRYDQQNDHDGTLILKWDGGEDRIDDKQVIGIIKDSQDTRREELHLQCNLLLVNSQSSPGETKSTFAFDSLPVTGLPQNYLERHLIKSVPEHLSVSPNADGSRNLHVIVSIRSGIGEALQYFNGFLSKALAAIDLHKDTYHVHFTTSDKSITEMTKQILLPRADKGIRQTIVMLSGDGGVVDIVNTLLSASQSKEYIKPTIGLIAMGTGNALANSSGLNRDATRGLSRIFRGTPRRIPTFTARFSPSSVFLTDEGKQTEVLPLQAGYGIVHGVVVCSWALHASLVADSDTAEYRKFGAQRFQMAAKELMAPEDGSGPHVYSGKITLYKSDERGQETVEEIAETKTSYIIATLVSKFEEKLTISPASKPLDGQLRVLRFGDIPAADVMRLMGMAMQAGGHEKDDMAQYAPINGLKINFNESDSRWRRVCVDGKIIKVDEGGLLEVRTSDKDVVNLRAAPANVQRWSAAVAWMLITPRTYQQLQYLEEDSRIAGDLHYRSLVGWQLSPNQLGSAQRMLLVHQIGSVKIGEVVRYTLTYTPSRDRILPSPSHLFVKVKNTSAIALRAAYLHGPYTLYSACYPSTFDPNRKRDSPHDEGSPEFEPNLKAGGSWSSRLTVPENIRETAEKVHARRTIDGRVPSFTWIIEVTSQVIFSTSATVHFELLVGRDEKAVELGFSALTGKAIAAPGQLQDHQQGKRSKAGHGAAQAKGVFSNAIELVVDDTASLWNKPSLPEWHDEGKDRGSRDQYPDPGEEDVPDTSSGRHGMDLDATEPRSDHPAKRTKKVHLVVLTHGLHSNLGADMLYLKESIDAAAKQARESARTRKAQQRRQKHTPKTAALEEHGRAEKDSIDSPKGSSTAPLSGGQDDLQDTPFDEDDEEEVIVRGFSGNAVRTERGIQYLGKRLAKYVLSMTYPDQPFLPVKQSMSKTISRAMTGQQPQDAHAGLPPHENSSIHLGKTKPDSLAYKITSISFIAHSLGGLTQTYAVAYIHKHSPHFFKEIKPVNFVALASPFLGLSNENPLYVKFALDFGLVGRTGQDLGLTWRAPAMVRSGWGAMIGGIGNEAQRAHRQPDPGSKPLLRILPTGPAHHVLKLFRNRTVYSNVVNDGIVPLRTSCLLFLDWSGLGRVEKARRENGLVGTMAGWGWSELTGANSTPYRQRLLQGNDSDSQVEESGEEGTGSSGRAVVPQPEEDATKEDTIIQSTKDMKARQSNGLGKPSSNQDFNGVKSKEESSSFGDFLNFGLGLLRPSKPSPLPESSKNARIYKRGQTMRGESDSEATPAGSTAGLSSSPAKDRPGIARGFSMAEDPNNVFAPPKTTVFESAGDILNPPLPSADFIINPESRPRTIFHDRVYHPNDIPLPPLKKRSSFTRSFSGEPRNGLTRSNTDYGPAAGTTQADTSSMKVEEKIARGYHHDLSWRKVLVRLEPDAHNNICVRRMFANAYGWPVVKHLVDTHFADTYAATTADVHETSEERAKPMKEAVGEGGEEVDLGPQPGRESSGDFLGSDHISSKVQRTESEVRESKDDVVELKSVADGSMSSQAGGRRVVSRQSSAQWDDAMFDVTDDEDEIYTPEHGRQPARLRVPGQAGSNQDSPRGTSDAEIAAFLTSSSANESGGLHLEQSSPPGVAAKDMPPTLHGYSTNVGLGKSMENQLSTLAKVTSQEGEEERGRSPGVSEAVSRLSIGKGQEH
ncbi:MAG: hypothetical protein Q9204_001773 [Flavoplaca sp. TL-2023a]